MNTEKQNLVLGMIAHYDFEMLRPFVSTLRATGYQGAITFFYHDIHKDTLARLRAYDVTLIPFNPESSTLGIYCLRYQLAYDYLQTHGQAYANVLLSDTRDVIFQHDPFDFPIGDQLCCFMERDGVTIANSTINAAWIEQGFGADAYARLADKPIVCSGVTIGSTRRVVEYLHIFLDTITTHAVPAHLRGMDQGIHNYLIHEHLLPAVALFTNNEGPVFTIGLEDTVHLQRKVVVNSAGQVPAVVHQYDRHWHLAKHYWSTRLVWRHRRAHARGIGAAFMRKYFPSCLHRILAIRNALIR